MATPEQSRKSPTSSPDITTSQEGQKLIKALGDSDKTPIKTEIKKNLELIQKFHSDITALLSRMDTIQKTGGNINQLDAQAESLFQKMGVSVLNNAGDFLHWARNFTAIDFGDKKKGIPPRVLKPYSTYNCVTTYNDPLDTVVSSLQTPSAQEKQEKTPEQIKQDFLEQISNTKDEGELSRVLTEIGKHYNRPDLPTQTQQEMTKSFTTWTLSGKKDLVKIFIEKQI